MGKYSVVYRLLLSVNRYSYQVQLLLNITIINFKVDFLVNRDPDEKTVMPSFFLIFST